MAASSHQQHSAIVVAFCASGYIDLHCSTSCRRHKRAAVGATYDRDVKGLSECHQNAAHIDFPLQDLALAGQIDISLICLI